jgi:small-conductance mechanosensitive channel
VVLATQTAVDDALAPTVDTVEGLYEQFLANLPLIGIALLLGIVGIVVAFSLATGARRGLERTKADPVAIDFSVRILRILGVVAAVLVALSIAGIQVAPALAGLGLAGLALAFAIQAILENFIAGVILLIRRPFRAGDQVRVGEFEGTVQDIDLRVTRLVDYEGVAVLLPNTYVYKEPLLNLTRRGSRRTTVTVGIDYRDDHDAAREVISAAVVAVDGVLEDPAAEVLLTEFAESSVNFEVRYWTLPDIRSVRHTQDRVLSAVKSALTSAGITIPWPIRTLLVEDPVPLKQRQMQL